MQRPGRRKLRRTSDYVIGADDTLHISVWKEPDLSETVAGASRWQDFHAAAERYSGGGTDSGAAEGFDHREAEKVYRRSARDGGGDGHEQPARFCDRRSDAHRADDVAAAHDRCCRRCRRPGSPSSPISKRFTCCGRENGKQEKLPFNYKEVVKGNHSGTEHRVEAGRHRGGAVRNVMRKRA